VVGGWRWLSPATSREPQLLFFLGPEPARAGTSLPWPDARPQGGVALDLRIRPAALGAMGLLPAELPLLVRRSDQLSLLSGVGQGVGRGGGRSGSLSGSLQLPSRLR
jgi:hypothetical protein